MVTVKQKVDLEVIPRKPGRYTLLVLTGLSRFTTSFTTPPFHLSRSIKLTPGGYFVVQLFEKQFAGLNGRHSQYLIGSTTMTLEPCLEHPGKQHFPLKLKNYFQVGAGKTTAQCSIFTGKLRLVPFKDRLGHYSTPGHSLRAGYRFESPRTFLSKVSMPYYFDETSQSRMPGAAFFLSPPFSVASKEKDWLGQFQKILMRFQYPGKISNRTVQQVSVEFGGLAAIYLIADAVTDVVTCYPYRPDKQESFDDVFVNRSGDCEDFAKGILRTWASLERTCRSASSRFMKSVGLLAGKYQAWAILGSVRNRSFSNACADIDSGEAAHMYSMLLPRGLFLNNADSDSLLPRVILEGTAKVSYLAGAMGLNTCKPAAPFYHLQPMSRVPEELARFYFRVAYAFLPGEPEFLVVNETRRIYGVDIRDILIPGPKVSFLRGPKYEKEVTTFIKTTYMKMQAEFQKATVPKLPLQLPVDTVLYEEESCQRAGGMCFLGVDDEGVLEADLAEEAKTRGAWRLTQEDPRTFRMDL